MMTNIHTDGEANQCKQWAYLVGLWIQTLTLQWIRYC